MRGRTIAIHLAVCLLFAHTRAHADPPPTAATPAADTHVLTFDIPAGPLDSVLARFATEAGVSLSFAPSDVQGKRSEGVHGTYTAANALTALLHNTGLSETAQTAKGYQLLLSPVTSPGPRSPDAVTEAIVLPPVKVSGTAPPADEFAATSSSTATRTATPLFYTPQSVAVVTPALIKSEQLQSIDDALRDISGLTSFISSGASLQDRTPYIRGFAATVMLNGMPTTSADAALNLPVAALSSIEVVKGANSLIGGSTLPGGLLNVTTKQPQSTPVHELTMQAGSYGDWLSSLDLAGPIGNSGQLTYRFVVSGENAARDFFGQRGGSNVYVAPSVAYDNGKTRLVVGFQQHAYNEPLAPYTVLLPSGPLALNSQPVTPAGRVYSNDTSFSYDLTQKLGDALTFHSQARYNAEKNYGPDAWVLLDVESLSPLTGRYQPIQFRIQTDNLTLDNNLKATLSTGPVKQTLVFGMAYNRTVQVFNQNSGADQFEPIPWQTAPPPTTPITDVASDTTTVSNTLYLQDQIVWNALHVTVGIDRSSQWGTGQQHQSAWSPSAGILYQLTDSVAAYANVQKSFYAQPVLDVTGHVAPPETGRSVETGLKFDAPDARYAGTVALFRIAASNVAISDPTNPVFYEFIPSGYVTRGIEVDATARLVPGWKLSASYTFTLSSNPPGTNTLQVPKHAFSLWTTYDLQSEGWHGWGAGLGIRARSSYATEDSAGNALSIAGQLRTDASIYYHARDWSMTLGVKNVFDRRLYGDFAQGQFTEVQPTRLFYLTGVYDF
ncbi:TonB-dependent siderophore receptor [Paraburkholderia flava]|uniref:TonB-dependent siderophore receptor n=1 Tax=Paraburkholderia flava TaxID=2547393 RepID=UPI001414FF3C|nr:TonB-dependent receptor [Paraburkholderia flava]